MLGWVNMNKYLKNSELYRVLPFTFCDEHITTQIKDGRTCRVIDDFRKTQGRLSIIGAMKRYAKSLRSAWCSDFYYAECANCTIYIDGWYEDDDKEPVVTASLSFKRSHDNESFEFIIATLGELDKEFEPLSNIHYVNEGEVLKLSSNFRIKL